MSEAQLSKFSTGRDKGEMDELKKLILSEKARTKHHDGGGGGGGDRGVDGGEVSDDDEGEGGARDRRGGGDGRGGRPGGAAGAKEKKQKGTWRRGKLILASGDDDLNKYRDRADERRKGHNPDYADKLNQMASMDAETTKYLGGDVEHTHLVKGLDYALLVKIREEERQKELEALEGAGGDDRNGERSGARGEGEVRARTLMGKTVLAVLRKLNLGQGAGGPDFRRVGYEFDLEPESVQEIPTAVAHSLGEDGEDEQEDEDQERHTNYLMEEGLLERVESAFTLFRQHGGKARRQRKRARDKTGGAGAGAGNEEDAIVAALAKTSGGDGGGDGEDAEDRGEGAPPPARRPKVSINIFEDVDDRYVPPGSARSATQPSAGAAAKGYFSGLRAANAGESNADEKANALPTRAEMSATVKAAARAAAARVSGDKSAASAAGKGGSGSGGGGGGGRDKIERDIFAARPSRGQALGVSAGGYDVYPETGDFETYDSDEDATNKKDAKPGPEGGGAAGGGGRRGGDKNQDKHPAFDKPKASFPYGVKKSEMSGRKGGGGGKRH